MADIGEELGKKDRIGIFDKRAHEKDQSGKVGVFDSVAHGRGQGASEQFKASMFVDHGEQEGYLRR